jgi:hypothetical protein
MGRPKKSAPKHVEAEEESQEIPEEEPEVEEEANEPEHAATMTKADVCRALLAEGITESEDALAAAKSRFGIEIKSTDFSLYKGKQKRGAATQTPAKRGRKPKAFEPAPPATAQVAPVTRSTAKVSEPDLIESLETLKPLIASLGAEKVKRLVDLLG